MAASKTLTPAQRRERSSLGAAIRTERTRLIKQIADDLCGEPLSAKTIDELRAIAEGAKAVRQ